jgi:hypothetical protein
LFVRQVSSSPNDFFLLELTQALAPMGFCCPQDSAQ